jgi:carotenoid 1,2-hydratase
VDLDLHRPFVRMRVHRTEAPSSFWLPLFSGPREGRWRRLGRRAEAR